MATFSSSSVRAPSHSRVSLLFSIGNWSVSENEKKNKKSTEYFLTIYLNKYL